MKRTIYYALSALVALLVMSCGTKRQGLLPYSSLEPAKREFRGAWLPTIFRSDYAKLSRTEARELLGNRIALLHRIGCNAVIFQVRAEGDAWYRSSYEPWSRFLTGKAGSSVDPEWDPLAFVIEECHQRGMEVHAWINPYRGSTNVATALAPEHLASKHPDWFVRYNKQLILDPGLPQSRDYICKVVKDLTLRYDIDALHLDDYFYPYPVVGQAFHDEESFSRYGLPMGYTPETKDKWRRNNVNLLIHDIKRTLIESKPWVRLGVSPFGIYRNKSTDRHGSETAGLQAYDDLYADVLHWVREGWVDYVAPQIYWNIGTEVADYEVLANWWGANIKGRTHLYVGQDVKRTMQEDQLNIKLDLSRTNAQGNIWWPADELLRNHAGISDSLSKTYYPTKALLPEYRGSLGKTRAPKEINTVWEDFNEDGHMLMWEDMHVSSDPETPFFYAIYAFVDGEKVDMDNPRALVAVTTNPYYKLPVLDGQTTYTFLLTAINRFWQESKPRKLRIKI